MKKTLFLLMAFVIFSSHDMFLKMDSYFIQPNSTASIKLYNGTFDKSDNVIARDRMNDVSLVGRNARMQVDTTQWHEQDATTILNFTSGDPGTWVAGVSTNPRNIEMTAADFNDYLEHDGVLDMLAWRKENNALEKDAIEKYSKHVKAIFQVGDDRTDDWQTVLGYPIEFVPLSNPYNEHAGHDLKFELLWQGEPLPDQLVYVDHSGPTHDHHHDHDHDHDHGHSHSHDHDDQSADDHHHHGGTQIRTDANGQFTVELTGEGIWYLRTIYLTHSDEPGLTHESNWATLTFEAAPGHSHGAHDHAHGDEHHHDHDAEIESGIPSYVYWIGSLVLVAGLFFWFNRQN